MSIRFIPLGVGDAFSALHYSSCLAVEAEGRWLLIDCPHPIRKILRESDPTLDIERFDAVVITHLHADHASGLEGYGYFSHFLLGKRAKLIIHPAVARDAWHGHLAAGMGQLLKPGASTPESREMADYFEPMPITESEPVTIGPFTIECRRTIHHIPTTALRIHAGGRCLAYSADTSFDPSLIDWLSRGDLIIHETNYGVHTPFEKLAALPADLRGRMRLIHYPDEFDIDGSNIEPLKQGRMYEV